MFRQLQCTYRGSFRGPCKLYGVTRAVRGACEWNGEQRVRRGDETQKTEKKKNENRCAAVMFRVIASGKKPRESREHRRRVASSACEIIKTRKKIKLGERESRRVCGRDDCVRVSVCAAAATAAL